MLLVRGVQDLDERVRDQRPRCVELGAESSGIGMLQSEGASGDEAGCVGIFLIEVLGNKNGIGNVFFGSRVVDGGKSVVRAAVWFLSGRSNAQFLGFGLDLFKIPPFRNERNALVGQGKSAQVGNIRYWPRDYGATKNAYLAFRTLGDQALSGSFDGIS